MWNILRLCNTDVHAIKWSTRLFKLHIHTYDSIVDKIITFVNASESINQF